MILTPLACSKTEIEAKLEYMIFSYIVQNHSGIIFYNGLILPSQHDIDIDPMILCASKIDYSSIFHKITHKHNLCLRILEEHVCLEEHVWPRNKFECKKADKCL